MKIILILLITLSLYAETFKEYKDTVGKDIDAFDKKYGAVLYIKIIQKHIIYFIK